MHAFVTVTPTQLPELLLHVAVVRPVFLWGQPGIGKSSLVEDFAAQVGLECQTLLGTQLAAEDLIGVPRIIGEGDRARSRFCPPEAIARDEPYVLFLDELNGSSHEVQKAFYSLILDRRLGSYRLHDQSVVIGAGNRAQDSAIVRPMSSAARGTDGSGRREPETRPGPHRAAPAVRAARAPRRLERQPGS